MEVVLASDCYAALVWRAPGPLVESEAASSHGNRPSLVTLLPVERGAVDVARLAEWLAAEAEDRRLVYEPVDNRHGLGR